MGRTCGSPGRPATKSRGPQNTAGMTRDLTGAARTFPRSPFARISKPLALSFEDAPGGRTERGRRARCPRGAASISSGMRDGGGCALRASRPPTRNHPRHGLLASGITGERSPSPRIWMSRGARQIPGPLLRPGTPRGPPLRPFGRATGLKLDDISYLARRDGTSAGSAVHRACVPGARARIRRRRGWSLGQPLSLRGPTARWTRVRRWATTSWGPLIGSVRPPNQSNKRPFKCVRPKVLSVGLGVTAGGSSRIGTRGVGVGDRLRARPGGQKPGGPLRIELLKLRSKRKGRISAFALYGNLSAGIEMPRTAKRSTSAQVRPEC